MIIGDRQVDPNIFAAGLPSFPCLWLWVDSLNLEAGCVACCGCEWPELLGLPSCSLCPRRFSRSGCNGVRLLSQIGYKSACADSGCGAGSAVVGFAVTVLQPGGESQATGVLGVYISGKWVLRPSSIMAWSAQANKISHGRTLSILVRGAGFTRTGTPIRIIATSQFRWSLESLDSA